MSPQKTALYQVHADLGAAFTDFGGWDMPLKYTNDVEEHKAVRSAAGLFDLSHMGEFRVTGPDAGAFLDYALLSNMSILKVGKAKYSLLLAEDGGVIDDLITYRLGEEEFLVIPNAANVAADYEAMSARTAGFDVQLVNETDQTSLVAVQGPTSEAILLDMDPSDAETITSMGYYAAAPIRFGDIEALLARTGYTGEDGFELFLPAASTAEAGDRGSAVWNTMLSAADEAGVELTLCGLASRDSLRLEAGMPLYGNELDTGHQPHASGVGFAVPASKEADFVGRSALVGRDDVEEVLVGLQGAGRRAARHGYAVLDESGERVGEVTSGAPSPTLGHPIALARVRRDVAAEGTSLQVDLRGRGEPFTVVATPFYRRER